MVKNSLQKLATDPRFLKALVLLLTMNELMTLEMLMQNIMQRITGVSRVQAAAGELSPSFFPKSLLSSTH